MVEIEIDGTLKPRGHNIFPTHDSNLGIGGYRTASTFQEMNAIPTEFKTEGCLCYCVETDKEYRWSQDKGWIEKPKEKVETRYVEGATTYETKMVENPYTPPKGIKIEENSISLVRPDGTKAVEICVDENGDGNLIFFDKNEKALGIFNPKIFE